jgi:hypothetical protein
MDQPQTYDYWKDTFDVTARPKLGFAGGRATANMTPLHAPILSMDKRLQSNYQENDFESSAMGIGLSLLEKEKEKLVEKKKQMVSESIPLSCLVLSHRIVTLSSSSGLMLWLQKEKKKQN